MLRDELADRRRIGRPGHPKGPGEGPAALGEIQTPGVGVQPGTSAGSPVTWVRREGNGSGSIGIPWPVTGRTRRHDDAEQLGGRRPASAPDTRSDRAVGPGSG